MGVHLLFAMTGAQSAGQAGKSSEWQAQEQEQIWGDARTIQEAFDQIKTTSARWAARNPVCLRFLQGEILGGASPTDFEGARRYGSVHYPDTPDRGPGVYIPDENLRRFRELIDRETDPAPV